MELDNKVLREYEEELDAVRAENKYLRNEIHKLREQCIQQHVSSEAEEEMITNRLLNHMSRSSSIDHNTMKDIQGNKEQRAAAMSNRNSIEARVQLENLYSEEQEYRINMLYNKLERVSIGSKGAQSPMVSSVPLAPTKHRRDHSTPVLLPIVDEYYPSPAPSMQPQRSASVVSGMAHPTLPEDAMRISIRSLQCQLAISERKHEKKVQELKTKLKLLQEENFHMEQRLKYHSEKTDKLALEKEVLLHAFEHETEMFFNMIPDLSITLPSGYVINRGASTVTISRPQSQDSLVNVIGTKSKPVSPLPPTPPVPPVPQSEANKTDTLSTNVVAPIPVEGKLANPAAKRRIYKRWSCMPVSKRSSLISGKQPSPVPSIDFKKSQDKSSSQEPSTDFQQPRGRPETQEAAREKERHR
jgi:hypothetical protein